MFGHYQQLSFKKNIISEDEASDQSQREEALEIFEKIKSYLSKPNIEEELQRTPLMGGSFVFNAKRAGIPYSFKILLSKHERDDPVKAGLGTYQGQDILVLKVLLERYNLKYIDTRVQGSKATIVHEIIHLLDKYKFDDETSPADVYDPKNPRKYYEHPKEFNAYFQETASEMLSLVRKMPKEALEVFKEYNFNDWLNYFLKSNKGIIDYMQNVGQDTKKRMLKRTSRFIKETLIPEFNKRLETENINEVTRPQDQDDAMLQLLVGGWSPLGKGSYGRVYEKDGVPYVLKIFNANDTAFVDFIRLSQSVNNPHFPKFQKKLIKLSPNLLAIRMEKLEKYKGDPTLISQYFSILHSYGDLKNVPEESYLSDAAYDLGEFFYDKPELKNALDILYDNLLKKSNYDADIKVDNIMKRGSDIVLIDPIKIRTMDETINEIANIPSTSSITQTGWSFKDVQRKPNLSPIQNRILNQAIDSKQGWETVKLPIRSLIATQDKVNPDYANPQSKIPGLPFVVKVNGEFYVFDGHHRIIKQARQNKSVVKVNLFDLDKINNDEDQYELFEGGMKEIYEIFENLKTDGGQIIYVDPQRQDFVLSRDGYKFYFVMPTNRAFVGAVYSTYRRINKGEKPKSLRQAIENLNSFNDKLSPSGVATILNAGKLEKFKDIHARI